MKNESLVARGLASILTDPQSTVVGYASVMEATTNSLRQDRSIAKTSARFRRGRTFFLRLVVLAGVVGLYLWPAIWNRGPFYYVDTRTYIRSVDAAINKVTHTRTDWTADDTNSVEGKNLFDVGQAKTRSLREITKKGVMLGRSLYWGLLPYIGAITGGFWLTIVLQSASVLIAIYLTLRTLGYRVWPTLVFVAAGLALVSDVAFFSSLLLPDLFVGFVVSGSAILIAVQSRMEQKEVLAWYLFLSWSLLCHDSGILVAASLLGVAAVVNLSRRSWSNWRGICIILLALITAFAGQSLVAYGISRSTHQAPLRFPFIEARLIADGPGTRYLRATCPQSHFALCEYVNDFPMSSEDFLFGTSPGKGVFEVASYERRRDLSAEQFRFLGNVLRFDPAGVLKTGLTNTWEQLLSFTLPEFDYIASLKDMMNRTFPESAMIQIRSSLAYRGVFPASTLSVFVYLLAISSFIYLLLVCLKTLPGRFMDGLQKRFLIWACAGLLLNAAISGGISFTHPRYQARVAWIIPLIALLVEAQRWIPRPGYTGAHRDDPEMVTMKTSTAQARASFLRFLQACLLIAFSLCSVSVRLAAQEPVRGPVSRSYFGLTVMRSRLTTPFDFGTVRVWDVWPRPDWAMANPSAGVYDFSGLDTFLAANNNQSRDVIYTFGRTPKWASSQPDAHGLDPGECAPPSDLKDWDNYVRAVVTHAAGRIKYWELWNEPNLPIYYCGDIPTLVLMAKRAQRVIKSIDPSAHVLSPAATTAEGPEWLSSFLAQGGSTAIDIVAFHGYRTQKAEDIIPLIAKYKAVMKANGVSGLPIWDTEADNKAPQTAEAESAFLAKYFLLQWSEGVARFVWYAYDAHPEWGQLWNPVTNRASAASTAYAQIYNWMVGATLVHPCSEDANRNWTCVFTRNGYKTEVLWNSETATSVPVSRVSPPFTEYRDLLGNAYPISSGTVAAGNEPILLTVSTK